MDFVGGGGVSVGVGVCMCVCFGGEFDVVMEIGIRARGWCGGLWAS